MVILKKLKQAAIGKKAILLDLDNTLYDYHPCHREALKKTHVFYSKRIEKLSFVQFQKKYNQARAIIHKRLHGQAASHSRLQYFQIMLEISKLSASQAGNLDRFYWQVFFKKMKLEKWVLPFLKFCRARKIKIVIVTNLTTYLQIHKLKYLKLTRKIDFLVTSEEAGVEKPSPKIFQLALKKSKTKPFEALIIGDDPEADRSSLIDSFRV